MSNNRIHISRALSSNDIVRRTSIEYPELVSMELHGFIPQHLLWKPQIHMGCSLLTVEQVSVESSLLDGGGM